MADAANYDLIGSQGMCVSGGGRRCATDPEVCAASHNRPVKFTRVAHSIGVAPPRSDEQPVHRIFGRKLRAMHVEPPFALERFRVRLDCLQ
jgi:hypothetical protein